MNDFYIYFKFFVYNIQKTLNEKKEFNFKL